MKTIVPLIQQEFCLRTNASTNQQSFQNDKSYKNFKNDKIVDISFINKERPFNDNKTTYKFNDTVNLSFNNNMNQISQNNPSKTSLDIFYQCKNENKIINKSLRDRLLEFIQINQTQFLKLQKINSNKNEKTKNWKFTNEEDDMLKKIVDKFGPKNWTIIASLIPGRTPRQCRDRYSNYLAPGFIHSNWSNEEDKLLADKYLLFGPKWSQIQQYFPNRTANGIKNRFKYTVCRVMHILRPDILSKKK